MRILILSINFHPETIGIAPLVTDLALALQARGHRVTVVTGLPTYPRDEVFEGYRGRWLSDEEWHGVRVLRTWVVAGSRRSDLRRLLFYASFLLSSLAGCLKAGPQDVIFCNSAPFQLGLVGTLVARLKRAPLIFNVQDLLTEAAVGLGRIKPGVVLRLLRLAEDFVYRSSAAVTPVCKAFERHLLARGVEASKVHYLPNWVDTDFIRPAPSDNAFRRELELPEPAFLVLCSGNLGFQMGLEFLLEAARLLREDARIRCLLVGDGSGRAALERQAALMALTNVRFLPLVPRETLPEMLAAADAFLVSLRPEYRATYSQPSRLLTAMAAARPLILTLHEGTDSARLVEEAGAGVRVTPGDPKALACAIAALAADRERAREMGRRGRQIACTEFAKSVVLPRYLSLLEEVGLRDRVSQFFDSYASAFDQIYEDERRGWKGLLNRALRGSLYQRMDLTVAALRPFAGKRIIDIGAGSGRGTVRFATEGAKEVLALDTAPQMLDIAQEHAKRAGVDKSCRFLVGDFLEVQDAALQPPFDHAVALGFFDYIEDPLPFLRRTAAIAKGVSVFSFPVRWHWLTPQRKLRYLLRRCPLFFYDEAQLVELLRQSGFRSWKIDNLGRDYFVLAGP